ncbi:unnamed protein product [Caenorhabditis auriculariae]|uniref:Brix domain-containing protein n=1 Tax=Caenorhabditis auriculariae TaxID=2777116 RepID=A0A8S1HZK6_9PELO|nr:unnamed protein product [Caenorhabditis auriculariae]
MPSKRVKKAKQKPSDEIEFEEEEVTIDVDEEDEEGHSFKEEEDDDDDDDHEHEPPSKKRKKAKKEELEDVGPKLSKEEIQELIKKYDEIKAKPTVTKDDFKHLPKSDRGKALKRAIKKDKRTRQAERAKLREDLGEEAPVKEQPKTIESTREYDVTMVADDDDEVEHDEANDEFAPYFNRETTPKVLITMSPKAKITTWKFCFELKKCIPNAEMFSRKNVLLKRIVEQAIEKEYTDLIVVHEDKKQPNGIVLCHLPEGPTAYFKINSLTFTEDLKRFGESTSHYPEVILNNFNTRLGHNIARMFACLFPHDPKFTGRRVVTLHNQRDYIFFRHHRYEFKKEGEKAALLELGPRFTLRLKWLQKGTFDAKWGEFEWVLKRHEMETSRRRSSRLRFLINARSTLGPVRHRFAWGEDAAGPNVPVGGKMGASENPELHTYDGDYRGSPSKGDKLIPDYFYRTPTVGRTYIDRCLTYFISAVVWAWFTYHMYYHSGHLFGHWYMPYLSEFTDAELGIPPSSEEDPEYWGNHGKPHGSYR